MNKKRKRDLRLIVVLLLCTVVVAVALESEYHFWSMLSYSVARSAAPFWTIPGFEGAKCVLAGARQEGWTDWEHYNEFVEAKAGYRIAEHEAYGYWDDVYFTNSDPYNQLIAWDYKSPTVGVDRIQMLVETQQGVQLENLDYMGDPLDWNETQQLDVIQYQPNQDRALTSVEESDETYYTLTKRSILLVPAEIHIAISIPATRGISQHSSGWQEGTWPNVELWFKLDFTAWNTIAEAYAGTDYLPETIPAEAYNANSQYALKGGFPISGWVQGYLENVGSDWPEDYDDEIWGKYKSGSGYDHSLTESSKATLNALTQTLPALTGRSIALYSSAADPYAEYDGGYVGFVQILDQARLYPFVPSQVPAYFPITVQTLGTHVEGDLLHGWDLYYPAVNYRIRVVYAVYGTFTYLWTVQTAEDQGYPGWEDRGYEWVHVSTGFEWILDLFSNPLFLIFLFLFLVLIILVIIAIFAPGVLKLVSSVASKAVSKAKASKAVSKAKG